jgi:beta-phosphoglucomutase-like phosphatase (HAD superfamily)
MKLFIFDFDGTLVDSRKLMLESHRVIFGEFGFSLRSEEESLCVDWNVAGTCSSATGRWLYRGAIIVPTVSAVRAYGTSSTV